MAIAFDASSHGNTNDTGAGNLSCTVAHICTGTNLILVVCLSWGSATNAIPTSVQYAGVNMTLLGSQLNEVTLSSRFYYLVNPTTGTNNIVATWSTNIRVITIVGMSFTGVRQTNPIGSTVTNGNTTTVTSISDSITTINDKSIVVDLVAGANATLTVGTFTATGIGETQSAEDGNNFNIGGSTASYYNAGDYTGVISPVASKTMSSNISVSTNRWAHILAEIIDATIPLPATDIGWKTLLGVGQI